MKALPFSWSKGLSTRFIRRGDNSTSWQTKHSFQHTSPSSGFAGFVLNLWNYIETNNKYGELILIMYLKTNILPRLWLLEFSIGLLPLIFFPMPTAISSLSHRKFCLIGASYHNQLPPSHPPCLSTTTSQIFSYWNWKALLSAKHLNLLSTWKLLLLPLFLP